MTARTDDAVDIDAPMELVWTLTNDVPSWPGLFSESAAADVLERDGETVRFRLTLHPDEQGNVWSWVSERTADASTRTVRAHRVETGVFQFLNITWTYTEILGGVWMRWVQEFAMKPDAPVDDATMTTRLNRNTAVQKRESRGRGPRANGEPMTGPALQGRRVLVTGGSRGIGRGIAVAMARAGAHVVTCHRAAGPHVRSLEVELEATGGKRRVLAADVSRRPSTPTPTTWISPARPRLASHSGMASTTASAPRSPGWRARSC